MKLSAIAAGLKAAGLLVQDASDPKVVAALATMLAADKKGGKDGLPVEETDKTVGKDKKGKDEDMPEGMDAKAWDAMSDEEKKEAKDKARDSKDKDDPEGTNDEDVDVQPKESVTGSSKSGQAGKEPTKDTAALVRAALDARDALHAARRDVETTIGVVAYDSAADVYKAALTKLGISVDGVDPSAYGAIFRVARDKAQAATPVIASDAAVVAGMAAVIPNYNRLK